MKFIRPAIVLTLLFVIFAGFGFPFLMYGIAQMPGLKDKADGSLITRNGQVVGSSLIGQGFTKPEYFHPRPSAAGGGYDANNSSGTNLGPTSDKLVNGIHKKTADGKDDPGNYDGFKDLAKAYRDENGLLADADIPADAATRSASGLDPHISPANAYIQADRVAKARKMSVDEVKKLVDDNTDPRFLGMFGDPAVNVLKLNLALDGQKP
jgi:K+-transporting ATPase ATPase C chain